MKHILLAPKNMMIMMTVVMVVVVMSRENGPISMIYTREVQKEILVWTY